MRPRSVAATILLLASALAVAWASVVSLSGGVAFGAFVSRDPFRPLIVGAILAAIARVVSPVDFDARLARMIGPRGARPARVAALAAAGTFVVALAWNTRAAGGSDSSCYVLQADAFAHGHALLRHPLAETLTTSAPAMFAPAGFVPSPREPFAAVPICAPGLALVMAPTVLVGGRSAPFLVVPVLAALAVWLTFAFGRLADDTWTGAAAACLVACNSIFLYQSVQPMSDVPATAFWLAALAATARGDRLGQIAGGAFASLAVLTRPNLALAIIPLAWLLASRRLGDEGGLWNRAAWLRWGSAAAPGLFALAWLNAVRYGSPASTGYGNTGDLFSMAHVLPNLARYGRWSVETGSAFAVLAVAAPWLMRADPRRARIAIVAIVSCASILVTYLAYTVFDDWWYLRFLLPILPVGFVYAVAVLRRIVPSRAREVGVAAVVGLLSVWGVRVAVVRQAFDLQALEARFVRTGAYAAAQAANTVFIAGQETASIRYHGDRRTIAWDGIPRERLDALVTELRTRAERVLIALEDAEVEPFRQRFAAERLGALDWRPVAELRGRVRVRVWETVEPGRRGAEVDTAGRPIVSLTGSARSAGRLPRQAFGQLSPSLEYAPW